MNELEFADYVDRLDDSFPNNWPAVTIVCYRENLSDREMMLGQAELRRRHPEKQITLARGREGCFAFEEAGWHVEQVWPL